MKIIGANVTGSFILNGVDVTNTLQSSSIWSGSVASSINSLNAATASLNAATASLFNYTSSNTTNINTLFASSASLDASVTSLNAATASLNTATASFSSSIGSLNNATASFSSSIGSLNNATASLNTATSSLNSSITSLNAATSSLLSYTASQTALNGTLATTGSNTFFGTQTITGSLFISQNLVVQGSSSVQNITASAVSIGTNTVILNTDTPAVRFGGIKVQDSGSGAGASGSLLWDSLNNHWIYQHPVGGAESGMSARLISGPKNSGSLGSEAGITSGKIVVAVGDDHIGDSIMTQTGTVISVAGDLTATSLTGSINGSQITNSTVANAKLANSTISGIALGSNLATLTIGTGLSGTSYNGSTGITITNSGVTSIVAGTGISINQGTGAVTVTNTITNNNQLTNGAGYITSAGNAATATTATTANRVLYVSEANLNTAFTNTPAGQLSWTEAYNQTNAPTAATYYNTISMRHSNASNVYGNQLAIRWVEAEPFTYVRVVNNNVFGTWRTILADFNYNSYAPTLTGTGASGTWGISITGNSATTSQTAFSTLTVNSNTTTGTSAGIVNLGTTADPSDNPNANIIGLTWGQRGDSQGYYIVRSNRLTYGGYTYNRLDLSWHTGIVIGAATTYGGIRFWNNSTNIGSSIASIGDGDNNMRSTADIIAYASDKRLKENIINIPNALDKIKQINGVYFDWKDKTKELGFEPSQKHDVGVIAQEIQAILPEVVTLAPFDYELGKSKSGEDYLTVKYEKIVPLLIEAIKEQQTQIEELKTIINGLTK